MFDTVLALAPVFLMIAAGWLARRFWLRDGDLWRPAEKLAYYVFVPALVIDDLVAADLTGIEISGLVVALLGAVFAVAIALLVLRNSLSGLLDLGDSAFTSVFQGSIRANFFITLAAAPRLLGDEAGALVILAVAFFTVVVNILSVLVLARYGSGGKTGIGHLLGRLARNPFIVAAIVAVVLNLSGVVLPGTVEGTLGLFAGAALPLALMTAGAGLRLAHVGRHFNGVAVASLAKLVAMPLIAWAIAAVLGLNDLAIATLVLFHSQPTAMTTYVLAREMGGDHELMATILTVQTVLAIVTIPVLMTLVI